MGMEGIYTITWAIFWQRVSYSEPDVVASCAVRNLNIRGARACFSSPAAFMRVQHRCINTYLSHYLPNDMSRKAPSTAYAQMALKRGKLLLASSAQKVRLEIDNSGSFRFAFA